MHAASQLFVEAFEVQIEGEPVSPDTVFPDWSPLDRFGIVVAEPLGGLGASLLGLLSAVSFKYLRALAECGRSDCCDSSFLLFRAASCAWLDHVRAGHAAHHVRGSVPVRLLHHLPYPVLAIREIAEQPAWGGRRLYRPA
jgi:hypothetical protein